MIHILLALRHCNADRRGETGSEYGHGLAETAAVKLSVVEIHLEIDIIGKPHLIAIGLGS